MGMLGMHQGLQGTHAIGHVGGTAERMQSLIWPIRFGVADGAQTQMLQGQVGQCALPHGLDADAERATGAVSGVNLFPNRLQFTCQLHAHGLPHLVDAQRVHHAQLFGQIGLTGQGEHQFDEGGVQLWVL